MRTGLVRMLVGTYGDAPARAGDGSIELRPFEAVVFL